MVAALAASLAGCTTSDSRSASDGKTNAATIRLFNGKDLGNFYTFLETNRYADPLRVFSVVEEDGAPAIRVSGEEFGGFVTRAEYENYRLVVEFKWGTQTWGRRLNKAMDSGILLHCNGPDGNYAGFWMASVECQIIEGGCGDLLMLEGKDAAGQTIKSLLTVECEQSGKEYWYHPGVGGDHPRGGPVQLVRTRSAVAGCERFSGAARCRKPCRKVDSHRGDL